MGGAVTGVLITGTCCHTCALCRHCTCCRLVPADRLAALFWRIRPHYRRWAYLVCRPFSETPRSSSGSPASNTLIACIGWPCSAKSWRWMSARRALASSQGIAARLRAVGRRWGSLAMVPSPRNWSLPCIDLVRSKRTASATHANTSTRSRLRPLNSRAETKQNND